MSSSYISYRNQFMKIKKQKDLAESLSTSFQSKVEFKDMNLLQIISSEKDMTKLPQIDIPKEKVEIDLSNFMDKLDKPKKEMKETFSLLDKNGDGKIDIEELSDSLQNSKKIVITGGDAQYSFF
jgi:Ca2+-binding EF-hand superfamily protein